MPKSHCVGAALSVLLLAACASTAPVRDFANASHKTMSEAEGIRDTWIRACDLNRVYTLGAAPGDFCDVEHDGKPANRQGAIATSAASAVVDAYFVALAGLASADPAQTADAAKAFAHEAVAIGKFSDKQSSAIERLATAVANVATAGWRDSKVWESMKAADDDIVVVTDAISKNITGNYVTQLNGTADAMQQHAARFSYSTVDNEWAYLCRDQGPPDAEHPNYCQGASGMLAWQAWQRNYLDDGNWVTTQQDEAASIARRITEVGKTHHWLTAHAGDIDTPELASRIYTIVTASPLAAKGQEKTP